MSYAVGAAVHDPSLRGTCRQAAETLAEQYSDLKVAKGYYRCRNGETHPHWWCVSPHGVVVDPTAGQFYDVGAGTYTVWNGWLICAGCNAEFQQPVDGETVPVCSTACLDDVGYPWDVHIQIEMRLEEYL